MNKIIRYCVRMHKGDYMVQDFDEDVPHRVLIHTVDSPIDSTLLKDRDVAERCIKEILTGNTNLLVLYDDNNPPKEVVELQISFSLK